MKKILEKILNIKSIIALLLIITLNVIIIKQINIDSDIFLLFSNLVTLTVTYFFTKRKDNNE